MYSDYDKELIRRGVIVPVFKAKPPKNNLNFIFKGKSYLEYSKARSKVRSLNLKTGEYNSETLLQSNLDFYFGGDEDAYLDEFQQTDNDGSAVDTDQMAFGLKYSF